MAIYTRSGDDGSTCGPGRRRIRVRKSDPAMRTLGGLDELAAHIGLCLAACDDPAEEHAWPALAGALDDLMALGAVLGGRAELPAGSVARLEQVIDSAEAELGELKSFILPGGCELACRLHVARTVCRRAEREAVAWADAGGMVLPTVLAYLNRLGDALFVLARAANHHAGMGDIVWPPAAAPTETPPRAEPNPKPKDTESADD